MKEVLYLSFDSLKEGVGASQVLAYMRKVQSATQVTIISFEKKMPTKSEMFEVERDGLIWRPLPFGRFGIIGGASRVFRLWLRTPPKDIHGEVLSTQLPKEKRQALRLNSITR